MRTVKSVVALRFVASLALALVLLATVLTGCAANIERAKQELAAEDPRPPVAVAVLFDNSRSYHEWIEPAVKQVVGLFERLAADYPEANVSLVLIASDAENIFSGEAGNLGTAWKDLQACVDAGRTPYTNLSGAVTHAAYFLEEANSQRRVMVIFSDMKHSMPGFYPQDAAEVPPPGDFPWGAVLGVDVYSVYVPFEEWLLWKTAIDPRGLKESFRGLLPEQMKDKNIADIVFPDD
jgi:hypothetical protein